MPDNERPESKTIEFYTVSTVCEICQQPLTLHSTGCPLHHFFIDLPNRVFQSQYYDATLETSDLLDRLSAVNPVSFLQRKLINGTGINLFSAMIVLDGLKVLASGYHLRPYTALLHLYVVTMEELNATR